MDSTSRSAGPAPAAPVPTRRVPAPAGHPGSTSTAETDLTPTRVPWAAVGIFAVLACGLAWLVQIPVWTSGEGLASPLFAPLTAITMSTPAVAALLVTFLVVRPSHRARYLGLLPLRPLRRTIVLCALWPLVWLALGLGAFFLALGLGWGAADWSLGTMVATLPDGVSQERFLLLTFAILPLNVLVGSVPALGEELGWRGFLTTALAPLGFWRAALLNGLLWGLWHAPVILLGYNFFRPDLSGLALMCGFTISVGVLLQWARYWARNVWVAAIGHGALNTAAPLSLLWLADGADTAIATLLGVPGWILMGLVVLGLVATGWLGRRLPRVLVPAPTPTAVVAPTAAS